MWNPDEYESQNFDAMPVGDYAAVIDEIERRTSNAGNEYLRMMLEVVLPQEHAGRKVWENVMLTDGAKQRALGLLKSAGVKHAIDPTNDDQVSNALSGAVVCCRLKITEYQGKRRNEVHYWIIPDEDQREALRKHELDKKDVTYPEDRGHQRQQREAQPNYPSAEEAWGQSASNPPGEGPDLNQGGDDIPF